MNNFKKIKFLACLIIMNIFLNVFCFPPVGVQAAASEEAISLEIEGVHAGYFAECTGIGSKNDILEQKVMGESGIEVVRKIPGKLTWNNIVLKRKITDDRSMWEWRKQVEDGDIVNARKNITIVTYNNLNEEVARWDFNNAWPCGISTSTDSSGSITEEIELVYEKVEKTGVMSKTYTIASLGDLTMNPLTAGYGLNTQEEKTVTITNTGTGTLIDLAAALSGDGADKFEISQPTVTTLDTDTSSTTFTVKAKDSLPEGTYTATVTISADSMTNVTFTVTQAVNPVPIDNAVISPYEAVFDLNAVADLTTTITWNSAESVSDIVYEGVPMLSGTDFTVSGDVLTVNQDFFSGLELTEGDSIDFEIFFDVGESVVLTVDIINGCIPNTNAALKELQVGSCLVEDFDADKFSYDIELPYDAQAGSAVSIISAEPRDAKASVVITQAADLPGTAMVEVTAEDKLTKLTYAVNFTLAEQPYTVTFNKNGGDTEASPNTKITASGGYVDTLPEPPTRRGYRFVCWNTAAEGDGTDFKEDTAVSSNITVYAQWKHIKYHDKDDVSKENKVEVEITRDTFNEASEKTMTELKINTGLGTIIFDEKAIDTVSSARSVGDIYISITRVDNSTLPQELQDKIGDRTVYDFSVKVAGTQISNFNGGRVKINISYTPRDGENINAIVIYYIDSNGKLTPMRGRYIPSSGMVEFITNHLSQYVIGYNPVSFKDVADTAWYNDAVTFLAARDIITGIGNSRFGPEEKLTRGQAIVMLMKTFSLAPDENPADNFTDAGNTYYTNYLAAAKRLGITNGIGNNLFAPNKEVTRQEMITLLYHSLKIIGELPIGTNGKILTDFDDADQVASWAADSVTLFIKTGALSGYNNKLSPGEMTKRAELAQILYNILTK